MVIREYREQDYEQVIALILDIQRNEFALNITVNDQPDLLIINDFYQHDNGNFWVASEGDKIIGTIALIDIGNNETALRKMFVELDHRGKEKSVAQQLMNSLVNWCKAQGVEAVYLGSLETMKAAHRFYERNKFVAINKNELPLAFPLMKHDTVFYKLTV